MSNKRTNQAKKDLIEWIEENMDNIDAFVSTLILKDGGVVTFYDCDSELEAFGIIGLANATITESVNNGEFNMPDED